MVDEQLSGGDEDDDTESQMGWSVTQRPKGVAIKKDKESLPANPLLPKM